MKRTTPYSLILLLSAASIAFGQSGGMSNMDMNNQMPMQNCTGMQNMDAQKCKDMMNGMSNNHPAKETKTITHHAVAVVKAIDVAKGQVILAHEPIKTLNWPAMTMRFNVKDKMLFDKLAVGKKVDVDIVQQGSDYIVTAVK